MAYLQDQVAIKQILEHLGLSPPEEPKPPPAVHEVVRVPVAVVHLTAFRLPLDSIVQLGEPGWATGAATKSGV